MALGTCSGGSSGDPLQDGASVVLNTEDDGFNCTTDGLQHCSAEFAPGSQVLLRASLQGFQSWRDCDAVLGTNFCRVTVNKSRTVSATFAH